METDHSHASSGKGVWSAWRRAFDDDMPAMVQQREEAATSLSDPDIDPGYRAELIAWIDQWDGNYKFYLDEANVLAHAKVFDETVEQTTEQILKGLGAVILGLGITGVTYWLAKGGGLYFVTWGLVAWGVIQLILGAVSRFQAKREFEGHYAAFKDKYRPPLGG